MLTEKFHISSTEFNFNLISDDMQNQKINGVAINPGKYKDFLRIEEDELPNIAMRLPGDVILKDHNNECDSAVGRVTAAALDINEDTDEKCVRYNGWIDPDEEKLIKKIRKGIIDSTSIGFTYEPYCGICGKPLDQCEHFFGDEGFEIIAKDIHPFELSIVSVPADKNATISVFNATDFLSEELIGFKEKKNKSYGVKNMDFEEKYSALETEFEDYKKSAKKELETLKAEHENKISEKIEETLSLKQLLEEYEEALKLAKDELATLHADMDKIVAERLSGLREQVSELNEKVSAGLTKEEIAELSENGLNRYIEMFSKIIDAQPSFEPGQKAVHKYSKDNSLGEDASTIEKLMFKKEQSIQQK